MCHEHYSNLNLRQRRLDQKIWVAYQAERNLHSYRKTLEDPFVKTFWLNTNFPSRFTPILIKQANCSTNQKPRRGNIFFMDLQLLTALNFRCIQGWKWKLRVIRDRNFYIFPRISKTWFWLRKVLKFSNSRLHHLCMQKWAHLKFINLFGYRLDITKNASTHMKSRKLQDVFLPCRNKACPAQP